MITTKEARSIIRKYSVREMYTNKLSDKLYRTVKCYFYGKEDEALIAELQEKAGFENVRITDGIKFLDGTYKALPGIIVRCEFSNNQ